MILYGLNDGAASCVFSEALVNYNIQTYIFFLFFSASLSFALSTLAALGLYFPMKFYHISFTSGSVF